MDHFIHNIYAWIIVSISIIAFAVIRWYFYRKHIKSRPEPTTKPPSERPLIIDPKTAMKTVNLPQSFSDKEIDFIENWYSEVGMQQLLSARDKPCKILDKKSQAEGAKYVSVDGISVAMQARHRESLSLVKTREIKTVTLLLLNEWIN